MRPAVVCCVLQAADLKIGQFVVYRRERLDEGCQRSPGSDRYDQLVIPVASSRA